MMNKKILSYLLLPLAISACLPVASQAESIPVQRKAVVISRNNRDTKVTSLSERLEAARKKAKEEASVQSRDRSSEQGRDKKETSQKKEKLGPDVEVGLLSASAADITALDDFRAEVNGKTVKKYKNGTRLSISRSGKNVVINGKKMGDKVYLVTGKTAPSFQVKGNRYRGMMKLIPSTWGTGVTVVNVVPMELYIQGVVPREIVPTWKIDAVKAQAVAARTYAVYHKNGFRSAGYDVTDDTRSQVYGGVSAETEATNRAVRETAGEVVTYGGKPIDALFHSSGGGYTENSENVWGSMVPYLRGVKEEYTGNPWTKTVSLDSFARSMGIGKLKSISLSKLKIGSSHKAKDRGISGRVKTIDVKGKKGMKTITGEKMQGMYGLSSTLFDISIKGKNLIIKGYGYGHGLGLSQWGAQAMAEKHGDGKDYYKKILTHYFTGTKIEKLY